MRIFALAFLLCLASVSEAAQMPLSVLPGGAVVFKPIQSLRERKFADLVQQKTDFSCGAAALATIRVVCPFTGLTVVEVLRGLPSDPLLFVIRPRLPDTTSTGVPLGTHSHLPVTGLNVYAFAVATPHTAAFATVSASAVE